MTEQKTMFANAEHISSKDSIYAVYIKEERINKKEILTSYAKYKEYNTLTEAIDVAERQNTKANKKAKSSKEYIVRILPRNLGVGTELYLVNLEDCSKVGEDHFYGTIVDEKESFYVVQRSFDEDDKTVDFLKDEFENRFLDKSFTTRDGIAVIDSL